MNLRTTALAATLLSTLLPSAPASAETTATYIFESVHSYNILGDTNTFDQVEVTGVVQGESTARTVTLNYSAKYSSTYGTDYTSSKRSFERCERLALLALSKPGQYLLEMRQERDSFNVQFIGCKLTRRVP
jgi:hypothetical protein